MFSLGIEYQKLIRKDAQNCYRLNDTHYFWPMPLETPAVLSLNTI